MAKSRLGRRLTGKAKKPEAGTRGAVGQAAVAEKNRQRKVRLSIIDELIRLGIPYDQWPDFVQAYYADPRQRTQYHHGAWPNPFQAPVFDRLNQSKEDWVKVADGAWERHRNKFLQQCESWVRAGVDEQIEEVKAARGPGKRKLAHVGGQRRGANTPVERRYEWAARYLAKVPLKEIAGNASTVGRIAREIVRSAGWNTKSRFNKPGPHATTTYQEYPKWKYHRTEPARIVHDREEELALGDGWENTPPTLAK